MLELLTWKPSVLSSLWTPVFFKIPIKMWGRNSFFLVTTGLSTCYHNLRYSILIHPLFPTRSSSWAAGKIFPSLRSSHIRSAYHIYFRVYHWLVITTCRDLIISILSILFVVHYWHGGIRWSFLFSYIGPYCFFQRNTLMVDIAQILHILFPNSCFSCVHCVILSYFS